MVFWSRAVSAKALQFFGASCVVSDNHSAVTGCAKVLGREEGKASVVSDRAGSPSFILGANDLRGVFNDHQPVLHGDRHESIHLRPFAPQMHWNDHASPAGRLRLYSLQT